MILLLNAIELRAIENPETLDIVLQKGKPAPYQGVLLPEYDYKELVKCEESQHNMMGEYMELRYECGKLAEVKSDGLSKFTWFIIGAAIGILAGSKF